MSGTFEASEAGGNAEPLKEMRLDCPCGVRLKGMGEDGLVEVAMAHLQEKHPDLAEVYTRDHILVWAY